MLYLLGLFATLLFLFESHGVNGDFCEVCQTTTSFGSCWFRYDCGVGNGCFTQTWITGNTRYYRKGCRNDSVADCETFNDVLCTRNNWLHCCTGDHCNVGDPVAHWKPEKPQNVVVREITSSSMKLSWDIQCNGVYTYYVEYLKETHLPQTVSVSNSHEVTISNLEPKSLYWFSIRSYYDDRFSDPVNVIRGTETGNATTCALTLNSTLSNYNSTSAYKCKDNEQSCQTGIFYPTDGGPAYVSRQCSVSKTCEIRSSLNINLCKPGRAGSYCHFCCNTSGCNSNNDIAFRLTCDGAQSEEKIDCGWDGIDSETCLRRGCCYKRSTSTVYDKWCYHRNYDPTANQVPSTTDSTTTTTSRVVGVAGLSWWLIIAIVVGILLLFVIIALIIFCVRKKRKKMTRGFYDIDPVYASPHKRTGQNVTAITRSGLRNPPVTIEELP